MYTEVIRRNTVSKSWGRLSLDIFTAHFHCCSSTQGYSVSRSASWAGYLDEFLCWAWVCLVPLCLIWMTSDWAALLLFQAPLWAYLLCAVGLFVYQSLDAIDGKQARRTNSSSPLGELFDHGCDSLSTGQALIAFITTHFCSFVLWRPPVCICVCSVCGVGDQYSGADGYQSRLDVLLLFCWHVHVLLCPLADVCVGNAALWHVSPQKLHYFWNIYRNKLAPIKIVIITYVTSTNITAKSQCCIQGDLAAVPQSFLFFLYG